MNNEYYIFLGDVVKSQKIKNKAEFGDKLVQTCIEINNLYNKDFFVDIKLLKDINEIGGIIKNFKDIYRIADLFNQAIRPEKIRIVLYKGPIEIGLNSNDFLKMSGYGIHQAYTVMGFLKKEKVLFRMVTGDKVLDNLITNNINFILYIKGQRTDRQVEIVNVYDKIQNQALTGEKFGVIPQTVSSHVVKSKWSMIRIAEDRLNDALSKYLERNIDEI
jgi:hypothetical protein